MSRKIGPSYYPTRTPLPLRLLVLDRDPVDNPFDLNVGDFVLNQQDSKLFMLVSREINNVQYRLMSTLVDGLALIGNDGLDVVPDAQNDINVLGENAQGINITRSGASTMQISGIDAATDQKGVAELSTDIETREGTESDKIVTPTSLKDKLGTQTLHGVAIGNDDTSSLTWTSAATDGQLLIGETGAPPRISDLTSSDGSVVFTPGPGTLDLQATTSGGVVGPSSSTDNSIAVFDGTGGNTIKEAPVTMPTSDGTNGQVLETDGSGNLTFTTISTGLNWSSQNSSFSATAESGFFVTATATASLPAGASTGATISFVATSSDVLTITAATDDLIQLGSASQSSFASTASGDSVKLTFLVTDSPAAGNGTWFATPGIIGTWS